MNCDETETLPSNILTNLRKKYITNPLIFELPEILIQRLVGDGPSARVIS